MFPTCTSRLSVTRGRSQGAQKSFEYGTWWVVLRRKGTPLHPKTESCTPWPLAYRMNPLTTVHVRLPPRTFYWVGGALVRGASWGRVQRDPPLRDKQGEGEGGANILDLPAPCQRVLVFSLSGNKFTFFGV